MPEDGTGHVFVLHHRHTGVSAHYQSFIREYTLPQFLRGRGNGLFERAFEPYYTPAQLQSVFDDIEMITAETEWSKQVDASYAKLFGMSPFNQGHSFKMAEPTGWCSPAPSPASAGLLAPVLAAARLGWTSHRACL